MRKRDLAIITYRWSIYIGIFVFFFSCFLGYLSHVTVDTMVKKAIIAASLLGVVFFISMRFIVNLLPDEKSSVSEMDNSSVDDSQENKVEV